jgi:3-phosphoshikimate 1-carboxyvinyltransferase
VLKEMSKSIELPGDKSISHRVAMIASLADNVCSIQNYNSGADCRSTLRCLEQLETGIEGKLSIKPHPLKIPENDLDCGNSGSTIRMLTGLLAGQQIPARLTGDSSLLKRPMKRVADPLREMGAVLELTDHNYPPIHLFEGAKRAIEYTMPMSSAQVKTAIMFAGLQFEGTHVIEQVPSRDHTERLFEHLQIQPGPAVKIPSFSYNVPGDPSSAAFLVVAALLHNRELILWNVLLNAHRIGFLNVLRRAGAPISIVEERIQQNEHVGEIQVKPGGLKERLVIKADEVAGLIDEIPALTMAGLSHGFEVHGANELRIKESDRIQSMVYNLQNAGLVVREWEDGFSVMPGDPKLATAKTFGDHRIAMAFAASGIPIDNQECVSISFPEFFNLLNEVIT